ncbi:MAG: discoidin domain-containing protein [Bacteroidetes bacterium]|nr:discoidin domain-containing protein [Bacteroidota bacterium]
MLLRNKILIFLLLVNGVVAGQPFDSASFAHPPEVARPWVFWYWMQAAVSKEGIRADLQAMKEVGIGGAYLMPINGAANPPVYEPVAQQLSPLWWDMVKYAMKEADSLGVKLAMHACDGFAVAGGPWITPEKSMQKVVWSRAGFDGGKVLDVRLAQPETVAGYYKDIAVLAMPTPLSWEESTLTVVPRVTTSTGEDAQFLVQRGSKETFKNDGGCWIQYDFHRPFTCRTIVVHSVNNYQSQRLGVDVSDDGIGWRRVYALEPPRHGWEDGDADVTHTMPAVTARYFRFVYDKSGSEPGAEDLDAAKWKPSLKVGGIYMSAMPAVYQYEGKNGEIWRVSRPSSRGELPDSLCVDPRSIVDVSGMADSTGHLVWRAPAGHWTILRVGHTSTGHTNATGGGGKGLECDKFDAATVALQFDRWFGEAVRQVGPELAKKVLTIFHVDSWECGSQNWSPVFRSEFRRRRGYDLLRWLPVMAGVPLASADSCERFLHDVRQTIAELVHDNFYKTMARLAHAKGCAFSAESVAPTMTSDGILHYSEADIPMGEFWLRSPTHDKPNDMLDAVAGAHVYGKPIVQAEAFTELRLQWDEYPGMLKALEDRNFALGINRMVFHVFTHNPWMDRKPGMTLGGVGNFFQRDQTWWRQGKAWIDYTRRCQWLLQQGRPVADVAVYMGEDIPRRAVLPERLAGVLPGLVGSSRVEAERVRLMNSGVPTTKAPNGVVHSANMADPVEWVDPLRGYAYDSYNPDVLVRLARVKDGRVVLPGGASYGLLVLPGALPMMPDAGGMSAASAVRLLELVKEGAKVLIDTTGVGRYHSVGLKGDDKVVQKAFSELLKRALIGPYRDSTLDRIGIPRDFEGGGPGIAYTHRTGEGFDIYFISNQTGRPCSFTASVRVTGRRPEVWDPVTGEVSDVRGWKVIKGRTEVEVALGASGSEFLVFRRAGVPEVAGKQAVADKVEKLMGPWLVEFGAEATIHSDSLFDWSRSADEAVRYYSGMAAYTTSFVAGQRLRRAFIDLGMVDNIATVFVNGVECGTVWTGNKVDITKAVHSGVNQLKVVVTNTWANRLTGDQRLPEAQRRTWTTSPWKGDGSLLPAGLLGPVYIRY